VSDKDFLKKYSLAAFSKPKKTPSHPNKKGIVAVKIDGKPRIIRFGDQKMGHNYSPAARKSFKARHGKNISKGPSSAAYWADKFFWAGSKGSKKRPPASQKVKKYKGGGFVPSVDEDRLEKGVRSVESLNGTLMMNPQSTATGLYGQRYSEIKGHELLKGITREMFAKDIDLQKKIFQRRLKGDKDLFQKKRTGMVQDGLEIHREYKKALGSKLPYGPTEVAALTNLLGRQGTREYMGYVLRDGKSLAEVFPTKYGKGAKQANKTPEEYIAAFVKATKKPKARSVR